MKSLQRSEQHLAVIQNSGRIEGLAQGLDFFIESFNSQNNEQSGNAIGFQILEQNNNETDLPE